MEEKKPIHKLAARWGLAATMFFFMFLLMMRFVYMNQKKQITALFLSNQKELSMLAAKECDDLFSGIARALKAANVSGAYPDITSEKTMRVLETMYDSMETMGVLDIVAIGEEGEFSSASGYLSTTGMSPEDTYKFLRDVIKPDGGDTYITEIVQIDKKKGGADYVILVAVPVRSPYMATEEELGSESPGFVTALVNVQKINLKMQALAKQKKDTVLFLIDRNGFFVSHPRPEFLGAQANEALNLGRYEKLLQIIGDMRAGKSSVDWYTAPDSRTGNTDTRWLISFSPTNTGKLSAAATFQENTIPILRSLKMKYLLLSFGSFVMILAAYLLLLRERNRFLDLENNATRLGDAAAVNEMLCTINADMTEEKKKLEQKLQELTSLNRERESRLKNLVELHEHLDSTIRRPTRGQRNLLNEISREIKLMLRSQDSRGRKRPENPPMPTEEPQEPEIPVLEIPVLEIPPSEEPPSEPL